MSGSHREGLIPAKHKLTPRPIVTAWRATKGTKQSWAGFNFLLRNQWRKWSVNQSYVFVSPFPHELLRVEEHFLRWLSDNCDWGTLLFIKSQYLQSSLYLILWNFEKTKWIVLTWYISTSPKEEVLQLCTILDGQSNAGVVYGVAVTQIQVLYSTTVIQYSYRSS